MNLLANLYGRRAYYLHSRRKLDEARPLYEKAVAMKTTLPRVSGAYGVVMMREGNFERATELFDYSLKLPKINLSDKLKIRVNRAICYANLGRCDKAIAALEDIHSKGPNTRVYETLGFVYIMDGQPDKAVTFSREALDYDDEDTVVMDNLGQAYIVLENWDEARAILEKALSIRGEQSDILYHLALVEEHDGHPDKARELAERADKCPMDHLNDASHEKIAAILTRL